MKEKIYSILYEIYPEKDFRSSNDFIEDGLIDSFDVIELVSKLEEAFSVRIDGTEIRSENFTDVQSVEDLLKKSRRV